MPSSLHSCSPALLHSCTPALLLFSLLAAFVRDRVSLDRKGSSGDRPGGGNETSSDAEQQEGRCRTDPELVCMLADRASSMYTPPLHILRARSFGIYCARPRRQEARPGDPTDGSERHAVLEWHVAEVDELKDRPDLREKAGSAESSSQRKEDATCLPVDQEDRKVVRADLLPDVIRLKSFEERDRHEEDEQRDGSPAPTRQLLHPNRSSESTHMPS